jgi:hypothetical protein
MIYEHLVLAGITIKGLLLLLTPGMTPSFDFEGYLNKLNISYDTNKHSDIRYVFEEYERLVNKLRSDLNEREPLKDLSGRSLNPLEVYAQIDGYKLRLEKIKLMTDREVLITENLHKPTGNTYIVAKGYWIDVAGGKKYRKFSKNIGAMDKVKVNGLIPPYMVTETKNEIFRLMWEQYKFEYPE